MLYAFLLDRLKDSVACTVSDMTASIKETSALLPQKLDTIIPLISTLSNKGLLLLVKGGESCGDWWIVLQKQALLSEMNGVIFAPKSFRQYKNISWSTGVVPFFKLKNEFPDYNPNMVSEFLTHLEFCFKIEDHQTLALLQMSSIPSLPILKMLNFTPLLQLQGQQLVKKKLFIIEAETQYQFKIYCCSILTLLTLAQTY